MGQIRETVKQKRKRLDERSVGNMGFSDRFKTAARVLAEKPAELAGTARLRAFLAKLEDDIRRKERELGRLVYVLRREGREGGGQVDALCAEIRALFDRRAELRRRLALVGLKGVSPCLACGEPVLPGARFCSGCGQPVADGAAAGPCPGEDSAAEARDAAALEIGSGAAAEGGCAGR